MDIVRPRRTRLAAMAVAAAVFIGLPIAAIIWMRLATQEHALPYVEKDTLLIETARRQTITRSVAGLGQLKPLYVRIVATSEGGLVDKILVKPGASVSADDVIALLKNSSVEEALAGSALQLDVALAQLRSVREEERAAQLTQENALSDAVAEYQQDNLHAESISELHSKGLIPNVQYEQSQIQAKKSAGDVATQRAQVSVTLADASAKITEAQAQVDQAQAQRSAAQAQLAALTVRAGSDGIVESVEVQPGMSVAPNTELAQVADRRTLKAVLQVAEDEVRSIDAGMPTVVSIGDTSAVGRVSRIAPAAQDGSVAIDVVFDNGLPNRAKLNTNVEGTIKIATLKNAVSIARPAGVSDNSTIELFKIVNHTRAERTRVKTGAGSSDRVQIISGIQPGDLVIISDMSPYLAYSELILH